MKNKHTRKVSIKNNFPSVLLYYFLVFYLIYARNSMLFGLNSNRTLMNYAKISVFVALIIIFFVFFVIKKQKIHLKKFSLFIFLAIILLVGLILNHDSIETYSLKIITLFLGYILAEYLDFRKVSRIYVNIMIFISSVSLIAYTFADKIISLGFFPLIYTSSRNEKFSSLLFTNIPHLANSQARNWGPFVEPGMYQAFLIIAILIALWTCVGRKKLVSIAIFVITLITTKSTAGFIVVPFVFVYYILDRKKQIKLSKSFFISIIIILTIYFYSISRDNIFYRVFGKLEEFDNESRWLSTIYGLEVWIENFFFGVGPSYVQDIIISKYPFGNYVSVTNTWVFNLASYGVFVGGLYLWGYYQFAKYRSSNRLARFLLYFIIILTLSSQNLGGSLFFVYLMFVRNEKSRLYLPESRLSDE